MQEYEALGHMERVNNEEIEIDGKTCYLPHHALFNENSAMTKVRSSLMHHVRQSLVAV